MASKAEDADGLSPFKDDNVAQHKIGRKYVVVLGCDDYICGELRPPHPRTFFVLYSLIVWMREQQRREWS